MSNQRVTIKDLQAILEKNNLTEIEIDNYYGINFILNGHKLNGSGRMTRRQAYDWLWAFIEGVRFEKQKQDNLNTMRLDNFRDCPFRVGDIISGPHCMGCDEPKSLEVKEIENDRIRVDYTSESKGWPYEIIWIADWYLYQKITGE